MLGFSSYYLPELTRSSPTFHHPLKSKTSICSATTLFRNFSKKCPLPDENKHLFTCCQFQLVRYEQSLSVNKQSKQLTVRRSRTKLNINVNKHAEPPESKHILAPVVDNECGCDRWRSRRLRVQLCFHQCNNPSRSLRSSGWFGGFGR